MTENQKSYSKGSRERVLQPKKPSKINTNSTNKQPVISISDSIFQKPSLEKEAKVFFLIISGGEVREKDYFKIISNHDRFKRIKIKFIADPLKLSPKGMFEIAEYKKAQLKSSQAENIDEPDKICLISDVDHFIDELIEIKPKCDSNNFHLIISNPCFEVWLYYAYCSSIPDFKMPENYLKISWQFKGWLNTKIKGGVNPKTAIFKIKQNIENAKTNYEIDEYNMPTLFSTSMFELAECLLPLISTELIELNEENNSKKFKTQE